MWRYSYYYQDQDYDFPVQRTHCSRCGSFLPSDPTREGEIVSIVTDWIDITLEDGTPYQVPEERPATEDEIKAGKAWRMCVDGPEWDCPKCGHTYDADGMFV